MVDIIGYVVLLVSFIMVMLSYFNDGCGDVVRIPKSVVSNSCECVAQNTKKGKFVAFKFFGKKGYTVAKELAYCDDAKSLTFIYQASSLVVGYSYETVWFNTQKIRDEFIAYVKSLDTKTVFILNDKEHKMYGKSFVKKGV